MKTDKFPSRDAPIRVCGRCNPTGFPSPGSDEHTCQYLPGSWRLQKRKANVSCSMHIPRAIFPCTQAVDGGPLHLGKHEQLSLSSKTNAALGYPWASWGKLGCLCALNVKGCAYPVRQAMSPQALNLESLRELLCSINKCPTWVVLEGAEVQTNRLFPLDVYTMFP